MPDLSLALKALRELGPRPSMDILGYRLGLKTGWFRRQTPDPGRIQPVEFSPLTFIADAALTAPPDRQTLDRVEALIQGTVTIFGSVVQPLDFSVPGELGHWTQHESAQVAGRDVKFTWEPARFCWVADLVRAYRHSPDPRIPSFFADRLAAFMAANPPYRGPHWANGQEVGLRLMNIALACSVFGEQVPGAGPVLAVHAARIPPTLIYARAQRNNHLLSEAAALYTAGLALPGHPQAAHWLSLGRMWFCRGVLDQFSPDGEYMQQSVNYQRLALQLAVWVDAAARSTGSPLPDPCLSRLAAGTQHLLAYCDRGTGAVPNLGANDGAYLFPLTDLPFADYRPVLQTAARSFLGAPAFPPGPWDQMSAWFDQPSEPDAPLFEPAGGTGVFLPHPDLTSRASLRAAVFDHRPGHADQLHVDLWWRGLNLAADPGTFLYNAGPPWDNALAQAFFHNTLTVDGRDQMTRAGRFLYVDRAQANIVARSTTTVTAEHDGYRALGIRHRRSLTAVPGGWQVDDLLDGRSESCRTIRLHWLLPDLPWRLEWTALHVQTPHGWVRLTVRLPDTDGYVVSLVRGGVGLVGPAAAPTAGWFSPTYGVRAPALSFSITFDSRLPARLQSAWEFPEDA